MGGEAVDMESMCGSPVSKLDRSRMWINAVVLGEA